METLDFSTNWNGKLFLDNFGTVRLFNPGKYIVGKELELTLKGTSLGIVTIAAERKFYFRSISDVLAYMDVGKPAHYLAELIKRFYEKKMTIDENTALHHVICHYKLRHVQAHESLLKEWWEEKKQEAYRQPVQQYLSL